MADGDFTVGKNSYSVQFGKYYRNGKAISKKAYDAALRRFDNKTPFTRTQFSIDSKWKKKLWSSNDIQRKAWLNKGGQLDKAYRPLSLSTKSTYFGRVNFSEKGRTSSQWGAHLTIGSGNKVVHVINGFNDWIRHIQIAQHQLTVQANNFKVVVARRALRVFQLAFKFHKFYNEDKPWDKLADYTMEKRMAIGTWKGEHKSKLNEYGKLAKSLKLSEEGGAMRISTDKVTAKRVNYYRYPAPHKGKPYMKTFVYAGYHNEDTKKGKKPGSKIPRRQFMGWSNRNKMDKIDMFAFEIADRYLLDSVFMSRKA